MLFMKENLMLVIMTAWRSPQAERLYKILEETDWQ
jgi:hypothetical protein